MRFVASSEQYEIQKTIHSGNNGDVMVAKCKSSRKELVLKKLDENKIPVDAIRNEIALGSKIRRPDVVRVYKAWNEDNHWYIAMEYLEGCDLFTLMERRGFTALQEKQCKRLFRKIVGAVRYLHKQNIIHRDLKLENVFLTKSGAIKLIDFGMSEQLKSKKQLSTRWCGSTDYVPPEILQRTPYSGFKVDVWCIGVMLYTLLYAEVPFLWSERVESFQAGEPHPVPDYPDTVKVSAEARDLVEKMLEVDPAKRISLDDVWSHPWLASPKLSRFFSLFTN